MTQPSEVKLEKANKTLLSSVETEGVTRRPWGRSGPPKGLRRLAALLAIALFASYVVWVIHNWLSWNFWVMITFSIATTTLVTAMMISGVFWRTFHHLPPAKGRILALIPVYNEDPATLHAAVRALIDQTIPPQQIHVVDDGSKVPIPTFEHPLVTWHRKANEGKRHAQAHVLNMFSPNQWDFVLTVDSDSVCDRDAVEHLLRAMTNSDVQAATGMIYTRNWHQNILTRLTDLNLVTSCLIFRMFRSWFGLVTPTSGALALYQAPIVYDNMDDYLILRGGGCGDDRRLSFYALMKGQVVGVHEAVVETNLPSTVNGMFNQRARWSKSAWLGLGFALTKFRLAPLLLYVYPLTFTLMWPFMLTVLIKLSMDLSWIVLGRGVFFWVAVSMVQASLYASYRPNLTGEQRFKQFCRGFVYPLMGLFILRPAAYWALTRLTSNSWMTRETVKVVKASA